MEGNHQEQVQGSGCNWSHSQRSTSCSQCPQSPHNPVPSPLPQTLPIQGLTFRSRERHIRALGAVTAWGGHKGTWSGTQDRRLKEGLWGGGVPMGSRLHCPRGSGGTPSILTGSLSVAPSFPTCRKETSCERPGRGQGHEVLKEPSPGPREVSRTLCLYRPRAGSGNLRKVHVQGLDPPPSCRSVLSRDLPSDLGLLGPGPHH